MPINLSLSFFMIAKEYMRSSFASYYHTRYIAENFLSEWWQGVIKSSNITSANFPSISSQCINNNLKLNVERGRGQGMWLLEGWWGMGYFRYHFLGGVANINNNNNKHLYRAKYQPSALSIRSINETGIVILTYQPYSQAARLI